MITRAVKRSLRQLRHDLSKSWAHQRAVRQARLYRGKRDLKLNLGCGEKFKPDWINVDAYAPNALPLDLREPFPFDDNSAEIIYSEHFFEHLEYPKEATRFLKECWRVLSPDGTLSLVVPDTEWPLRAYVENDSGYFKLAREKYHPKWCDTKMHNLNYHFRQGDEHKYAYDFETLAAVLEKNGFDDICRRDFDPELDTESRRIGSLYVRATKRATALQ